MIGVPRSLSRLTPGGEYDWRMEMAKVTVVYKMSVGGKPPIEPVVGVFLDAEQAWRYIDAHSIPHTNADTFEIDALVGKGKKWMLKN